MGYEEGFPQAVLVMNGPTRSLGWDQCRLIAAPSVSTVIKAGIGNHGACKPECRRVSSLSLSLPVCSMGEA